MLPFQQRYDLGVVILNNEQMDTLSTHHKSQMLVKLRDLMAKRIVVLTHIADEQLLEVWDSRSSLSKRIQSKISPYGNSIF